MPQLDATKHVQSNVTKGDIFEHPLLKPHQLSHLTGFRQVVKQWYHNS